MYFQLSCLFGDDEILENLKRNEFYNSLSICYELQSEVK